MENLTAREGGLAPLFLGIHATLNLRLTGFHLVDVGWTKTKAPGEFLHRRPFS
jgi:hypothetical protein